MDVLAMLVLQPITQLNGLYFINCCVNLVASCSCDSDGNVQSCSARSGFEVASQTVNILGLKELKVECKLRRLYAFS